MRDLFGHGDVMRLHVKDEEPRLVCRDGGWIAQLGGVNAETLSVDRVQSGKGQRHPARRAQKLAPIDSSEPRFSFGTGKDFVLEALLFRRLRNRKELLVRDGLRGDGQIAAEPCVEIRFADPAVARNWFGGGGSSLGVRHVTLLAVGMRLPELYAWGTAGTTSLRRCGTRLGFQ